MSNNYRRNNFQRGRRGGKGGHQKHDQQNISTFQLKKPFEFFLKKKIEKNFRFSRRKRKKVKSLK